MSRNGGLGVKPSAILDALKNPKKIVPRIDEYGRHSIQYRGAQSTVALNLEGKNRYMLGSKFEVLEEQNIMTVDRAIQLINEYIVKMGNEAEETLKPVEYRDLLKNHKLCEVLIDFLGDIYICHGIDANCRDNHFGGQVQQLITFLASLVSEERC